MYACDVCGNVGIIQAWMESLSFQMTKEEVVVMVSGSCEHRDPPHYNNAFQEMMMNDDDGETDLADQNNTYISLKCNTDI